MDWGNFVLSVLVAIGLGVLIVGLIRQGANEIVAVVAVAILAIICRNLFHIRAFELGSWKGWFVLLIIAAAVVVIRLGGLAVLMAMAAFVVLLGGFNSTQARATQTPGNQPGATTTTKPPEACNGFNVVMDPNTGDRQVSDGINVDVNDAPQTILDKAKHDPRYLHGLYNTLFPDHSIDDWQTLVTDGCYTSDAQAKWYEAKGNLQRYEVAAGEAPPVGNNTGTDQSGNFQVPGPISGNRAAYVFTDTQTGKTFYVMKRCGNFVTPTPIPNVPQRPPGETPTTQPPHVTTTTAPPTTTTVPPTTTTTLKCPQGSGSPDGQQCIPDSSIPRQPVQDDPAGPTPGVSGPPPSQPTNNQSNPQTAPNQSGSNTGCSSCGQQGTTTGPDGTTSGSTTGQQGGTNGTDQSTPAADQPTNTGMPPEPAAYHADASSGNLALLLIGGMVLLGLLTPIRRASFRR